MRLNINGNFVLVSVDKISGNCYLNPANAFTIHRNSEKGTDGIHQGIVDFYSFRLRKSCNFEAILTFGDFPVHVKKDEKYYLNGKLIGLDNIANILARLTYSLSVKVEDLATVYFKCITIPENIRYALENRVPYHFYEEWTKIEVRLNVQRISHDRYALEISDSVWGEISSKDLNTFINSYRFNKKRGNWHSLSPRKLYSKLIEREPSESELKLMVAFLKQNRTRDIVEKRAKELVSDMVSKFPDRLFYIKLEPGEKYLNSDGDECEFTTRDNEILFVRGQKYDWKIQKHSETSNKADRQSVSVYLYNSQRRSTYDEDGNAIYDDYGSSVKETVFLWKGPICIDNMTAGGGNSIGDQMIARALTLMNDKMAVNLVSTINSYIGTEDMSNHRLSFNDLEELVCLV